MMANILNGQIIIAKIQSNLTFGHEYKIQMKISFKIIQNEYEETNGQTNEMSETR